MKKILIIEDEEFVQFFYNVALSEEYELDKALDGFTAIEKLENNKYDLVILDINMPFFDGIEVLEKLKGKEQSVIVVSANGSKEKKQKAFDFGAKEYIVKPIDIFDLKEKLKKWC